MKITCSRFEATGEHGRRIDFSVALQNYYFHHLMANSAHMHRRWKQLVEIFATISLSENAINEKRCWTGGNHLNANNDDDVYELGDVGVLIYKPLPNGILYIW